MPYKQLTHEQRYTIYSLKKKGFSKSSIASVIDVHRSTVYRELTRNTGQRGYRFKQAQKLTKDRRLNRPEDVDVDTADVVVKSPRSIFCHISA